jgi:hypothetical protein
LAGNSGEDFKKLDTTLDAILKSFLKVGNYKGMSEKRKYRRSFVNSIQERMLAFSLIDIHSHVARHASE